MQIPRNPWPIFKQKISQGNAQVSKFFFFCNKTKLQRFKVSQNPTHRLQCGPCLPFNQEGRAEQNWENFHRGANTIELVVNAVIF